MSHPAGQSPIDLLDTYLEALSDALWDGFDHGADGPPPLPERPVLAGPGAEKREDELVAWALGRLDGIPREPKEAFQREVNGLLRELRSRRDPWNAAALRLLDDHYTFAATGPRLHEDWTRDAIAVMHRSVPDPRRRVRLDWDRNNTARQTVPAYPFEPPAASGFSRLLHPLEKEAAVASLAIMTESWQAEPAPVRSRPDRDAVVADARTLLDRYGPTARFWTTAEAAASDPAHDFIASGLPAYFCFSGFLTCEYINGLDFWGDLGLIAVSKDEVGLFWAIAAY
ncbi:hypothetical protein ABT104_00020 [Streptomyces mobaraensis]|uniref:hypothetical protein n=1 Tax=Streptomyces mobaraensis TaxID=35621 RepID=UPI00331F21E6